MRVKRLEWQELIRAVLSGFLRLTSYILHLTSNWGIKTL